MGERVFLLYETEDWKTFSAESPDHGADQHFGVTFPSVLRHSVQKPHGAVVIQQDPGHGLAALVTDATRREVGDEVFNVVVAFLVPPELPGFIHQVDVGNIQR